MHRNWIALTKAAAVLLAASSATAGPEWVEQDHGSGDTSSLPGTGVQAVSSPNGGAVSKITGKLGALGFNGPSVDFEDMYLIRIDDPSNFFATTVPQFGGSADFDSRLFLFRVDGTGLLGNDDTTIIGLLGSSSAQSTLGNMSTDGTRVVVDEPGLYLLCVTSFISSPQNNNGFLFSFGKFGEVSGPDGPGGADPITEWFQDSGKFQPGFGFSGNYEIFLGGAGSVETGMVVDLDLKPGGCPNSFNRGSNGVLPAAILGTATFDVHDIDLSTVVISRDDGLGGSSAPNEGPPGPHSTYSDVGTPFVGNECDCHSLGGDGITDLSMKFKSADMVAALQLNDLPAGALVRLKVSGELTDGTLFESFDCLRLVPPGTPPGMLTVRSNLREPWINSSPLDLQLDGGGFATFQRTFPLTTVVTLNAPNEVPGKTFQGWRINGSATLVPGKTLVYTVTGATTTIDAIFGASTNVAP